MSTGVWTNNWRAVKNLMVLGSYQYGLTTMVNDAGTTIETQDGATARKYAYSAMTAYSLNNGSGTAYPFIVFGSGSTTPTAADYTMGSTVGMSYVEQLNIYNVSLTVSGSTVTRVVKLVIRNRSDSATVTITEWGIEEQVNSNVVLLYHELLDSPVTLQPNQSATLTLTLTMTLDDPVSGN